MEKIKLDIVAISHSVTQSHNYAVILNESEGNRRLPIVIGGFEAQAIAVALEKMTPNRPLTHDLFKNTLDNFKIYIKEVIINDLIDGIFYAQLICEQEGDIYVIDSRTSDAIAMAVRYDAPIYTYEFILEAAGLQVEADGDDIDVGEDKTSPDELERMTEKQLEDMLNSVLEAEDYERAAAIRDEINRRKS